MDLSPTLAERFARHTQWEGDCLIWTKACSSGYGVISIATGRVRGAHVVAFFLHHGRWPIGVLRHRCDTPSCCNIDHLIEGTQSENIYDAVAKGRWPTGTKHHNGKLTDEQAKTIIQRRRAGASLKELAVEFSVSVGLVSDIATGRLRKHLQGG